MKGYTALILAGGKGTRMRVPYPKVLSDVHGKTLIEYCVDAHCAAGAERVVVVTGFKGELVREVLGDRVEYVHQSEQLGTGHAVLQAKELLEHEASPLLITMGDMPFLTSEMYTACMEALKEDVTCVVFGANWPEGRVVPEWGRFVTDSDGRVRAIVEQKDCTDEQRAIRALNANVYAVRAHDVFKAVDCLNTKNAQHEYYLTDIVGVFVGEGKKVEMVLTEDVEHLIGINNPDELQQARELHAHDGIGGHAE